MKKTQIRLFFGMLALAAWAGCAEYQEFSYGGYSLEQQNGGFTVNSAAPQFASEELNESLVQELSYINDDDEEQQAENQAPQQKPIVTLRLLWGQFPANPQLDSATRFQGIVYAQGARVFIQRVLFYERQDFGRHCADRACVVIDSVTKPHHDGLVLKIVPRPDANVPLRVFVGFKDLYGRVLELEELAGGFSELATVDALGNKVALQAVRRSLCPGGTIQGLWKRLSSRGGIFAGRWLDEAGQANGVLAGIWGRRANGEQVFFGIYGDKERNFLGLLKGTYRFYPALGGGRLAGHWVGRGGELGGVLFGIFHDRPADGALSGGFHGRYRLNCGKEALDPGDLPADCLNTDAEYCAPGNEPPACECNGRDCSCNYGSGAQGEQDPNLGNCTCSAAAEPECSCQF